MKRFFYTLSILLISIIANAQTPAQLDAKNGFNKFILGQTRSSIAQTTNLVKLSSVSQFDSYYVSNPENYKLFGYSPKNITLDFYGDLLIRIYVNLPKPPTVEQDLACSMRVLDNYKKLYGYWEDLEASDPVIVKKVIYGFKVVLYFFLYKEGSSITGDTYCYMSIPLMELSESK